MFQARGYPQENITKLHFCAGWHISDGMTGDEAIRIVRNSGVSQAEFARLIGMSPMGVQKWASGGKPSGPAAAILRIVRERPDFIETLRKTQE
ncbi:hypothetical protein SAMN04488061_2864 [Filomicrobium insigne]|uniref:HTH cro/C1-type domain-containing protein n=2 Tax=Hyphomicrobiaceae TaxID=45401 RepID=A0A1H0SEE5_9HYPH|nr:hypothetical protein SAMN04488061_2864 [Filomicrobium insigne]